MIKHAKTIADIHDSLVEERTVMEEKQKNCWKWDKHIPITVLGAMAVQLVAIVWFGSAFYTQTTVNQTRNEERFTTLAKARESSDAQNQTILTHLATLDAEIRAQTDIIKDIRDILRSKGKI